MQITIKIKGWSGRFEQFSHNCISITLSLSISKFPQKSSSQQQITLTRFYAVVKGMCYAKRVLSMSFKNWRYQVCKKGISKIFVLDVMPQQVWNTLNMDLPVRWKGLSRCALYQMIFIFQCDKIDEPHKA